MIETLNGKNIGADRPRWIERSTDRPLSVTGEQAENIIDAIHMGSQFNCYVAEGEWRRSILSDITRETCVTRFDCPVLLTERWAVEVWNGNKKWTRDFKSKNDALLFQSSECDRLGI